MSKSYIDILVDAKLAENARARNKAMTTTAAETRLELADELKRELFFPVHSIVTLLDLLRQCEAALRSPANETARLREALREEIIEHCANIALAIDSGRGNEKEIAKAIRALLLPRPVPCG
jgi:hypothetical protein